MGPTEMRVYETSRVALVIQYKFLKLLEILRWHINAANFCRSHSPGQDHFWWHRFVQCSDWFVAIRDPVGLALVTTHAWKKRNSY